MAADAEDQCCEAKLSNGQIGFEATEVTAKKKLNKYD